MVLDTACLLFIVSSRTANCWVIDGQIATDYAVSALHHRCSGLPHYDSLFRYTALQALRQRELPAVYLIAIGWVYVVLMMAVAEATSSSGSLLGAFFTFVLYGVLPLSIVLYLVATPARRAARRRRESQPPSRNPDGSGHAAGDTVPPVRKEP
jgi:hypothetical protein